MHFHTNVAVNLINVVRFTRLKILFYLLYIKVIKGNCYPF